MSIDAFFFCKEYAWAHSHPSGCRLPKIVILKKTLNRYVKAQGYQNYTVYVNNVVHGRVYRTMITHGNLKKVDFIKRRLPSSIEAYYNNDMREDQIPGTLKTSMLSPTSLPQNYKNYTVFQHRLNSLLYYDD